jgi:hypothetical protein
MKMGVANMTDEIADMVDDMQEETLVERPEGMNDRPRDTTLQKRWEKYFEFALYDQLDASNSRYTQHIPLLIRLRCSKRKHPHRPLYPNNPPRLGDRTHPRRPGEDTMEWWARWKVSGSEAEIERGIGCCCWLSVHTAIRIATARI